VVKAAAQAQAIIAAAKNQGGGLVPMNVAQIHALSQIQAQAIVNACPQTGLVVGGRGSSVGGGGGEKPQHTPQQIQNQVQLQAQAFVHAHTQAQSSAATYKGGDSVPAASAVGAKQKHVVPPQGPTMMTASSSASTVVPPVSNLVVQQLQIPPATQMTAQMKRKHPGGGIVTPAPAVPSAAIVLPSAMSQSYPPVAPTPSSMTTLAPPLPSPSSPS
jgi:hypothetical protein